MLINPAKLWELLRMFNLSPIGVIMTSWPLSNWICVGMEIVMVIGDVKGA